MKINTIKLSFPEDLTCLAGFQYGQKIYKEQVKHKVDIESKNILIFPSNIELIACGFIGGLFASLIDSFGGNNTLRIFDIYGENIHDLEKIKKQMEEWRGINVQKIQSKEH